MTQPECKCATCRAEREQEYLDISNREQARLALIRKAAAETEAERDVWDAEDDWVNESSQDEGISYETDIEVNLALLSALEAQLLATREMNTASLLIIQAMKEGSGF